MVKSCDVQIIGFFNVEFYMKNIVLEVLFQIYLCKYEILQVIVKLVFFFMGKGVCQYSFFCGKVFVVVEFQLVSVQFNMMF